MALKDPKDDLVTIEQFFDRMEEWNAGVAKVIARDEDDKPIRALIGVIGEGVDEIVEAIERVEAEWDAEAEEESP